MNCQEARRHLQDRMDGALAPPVADALETHLAACPDCQEALGLQQAARAEVRRALVPPPVPPRLEREVRALIQQSRVEMRRRWPRWALPVAAAALFLLTLTGITYYAGMIREDQPQTLLAELVEDHIRLRIKDHPADTHETDPGRLKAWFESRLDFPVVIPRRVADELRLEGGEISYILGRRVACLIYTRGDDFLTLYLLPRRDLPAAGLPGRDLGRVPLRVGQHREYRAAIWEGGELLYALVSDLDDEALLRAARQMTTL